MPETMIEQVARAMRKRQASALDMTDHFGDWESASEGNRQEWRALARAGLTAMREPTEAMERSGDNFEIERVLGNDGTGVVTVGSTASAIWTAMIDAALAEEG